MANFEMLAQQLRHLNDNDPALGEAVAQAADVDAAVTRIRRAAQNQGVVLDAEALNLWVQSMHALSRLSQEDPAFTQDLEEARSVRDYLDAVQAAASRSGVAVDDSLKELIAGLVQGNSVQQELPDEALEDVSGGLVIATSVAIAGGAALFGGGVIVGVGAALLTGYFLLGNSRS